MKLVPVESSMISGVGYDEDAEEMEVSFNDGKVYRYTDVPKSVYEELLAAKSKGHYMLENVINLYPDYQVSGRKRWR